MFISPAYAQAASDIQGQITSLLPLFLIAAVFYFLLIRPQQQKMKQLKAAQGSLRRGDKIVTAGGVIGTVVRVLNDDEVAVEIAEGVRVRIVRSTISTVLAKTEPAAKDAAKEPAEEDAPADAADAPDAKKRRTNPKTSTAAK